MADDEVEDDFEQHGPITLAVCWIHATAPEALGQIAEMVSARSASCRLFHVRGSAVANLAEGARRLPEWLARYPQIQYRQVILGFVVEQGASGWLTHQEISDGVISALREDAPFFSVVGTVEPWMLRP